MEEVIEIVESKPLLAVELSTTVGKRETTSSGMMILFRYLIFLLLLTALIDLVFSVVEYNYYTAYSWFTIYEQGRLMVVVGILEIILHTSYDWMDEILERWKERYCASLVVVFLMYITMLSLLGLIAVKTLSSFHSLNLSYLNDESVILCLGLGLLFMDVLMPGWKVFDFMRKDSAKFATYILVHALMTLCSLVKHSIHWIIHLNDVGAEESHKIDLIAISIDIISLIVLLSGIVVIFYYEKVVSEGGCNRLKRDFKCLETIFEPTEIWFNRLFFLFVVCFLTTMEILKLTLTVFHLNEKNGIETICWCVADLIFLKASMVPFLFWISSQDITPELLKEMKDKRNYETINCCEKGVLCVVIGFIQCINCCTFQHDANGQYYDKINNSDSDDTDLEEKDKSVQTTHVEGHKHVEGHNGTFVQFLLLNTALFILGFADLFVDIPEYSYYEEKEGYHMYEEIRLVLVLVVGELLLFTSYHWIDEIRKKTGKRNNRRILFLDQFLPESIIEVVENNTFWVRMVVLLIYFSLLSLVLAVLVELIGHVNEFPLSYLNDEAAIFALIIGLVFIFQAEIGEIAYWFIAVIMTSCSFTKHLVHFFSVSKDDVDVVVIAVDVISLILLSIALSLFITVSVATLLVFVCHICLEDEDVNDHRKKRDNIVRIWLFWKLFMRFLFFVVVLCMFVGELSKLVLSAFFFAVDTQQSMQTFLWCVGDLVFLKCCFFPLCGCSCEWEEKEELEEED